MKIIYDVFVLLTIFCSVLVFNANGADGSLDTDFGNGGKVKIDFDGNPTPGAADIDFGLDVAIQPDGKIIVSGESFITTTDSAMSVTRLNSNGTLDQTFATNGRLLFNSAVGVAERAYAVAVQPDGKIIIAGRTNTPRTRVVIRLNADGTFDNSFAESGVFQRRIGEVVFDEPEIAIQPDGKIVISGASRNQSATDAFSLIRLTPNGQLDASFDTDGVVDTIFGSDDRAYAVTLQPDGKIIASGSSSNNGSFSLARYNSDGTLDTSFDGDGKVTTAFPSSTALAYNVTVQPDGKIIAAGYARSLHADGALVRYNPNGSLDTSFSGDGIATYGTSSNELFWDVHVKKGKIIATGFRALVDPSPIEDFMVVRFNANGSLDTLFGTNGAVFTDFSTTRDDCLSSAFQPDGKLVLAGYSTIVTPNNPDFAVVRYNFSTIPTAADFNGDGRSDLSVLRTVSGAPSQWWWQSSQTATVTALEWGLSGDVPTPADFDGDGTTDIAIWRPAPATQAAFYILNSATNTVRVEQFGQTSDNPAIVGDYDGDGKADPAVYRSGSQSQFYFRGSVNNPNGDVSQIGWGTNGDRPVAGNFDGDATMDFAVYRNGTWWILLNSAGTVQIKNWGLPTDKIAQADYDGDGKTDLAVVREGIWYIQNSTDGSFNYQYWGLSEDSPVPADYDGDGRADLGVFRGGTWFVRQSSGAVVRITSFGSIGDVPIPFVGN